MPSIVVAVFVALLLAQAAVAQALPSYLISTIAGGAPPVTAAPGTSMMASVYNGGVATDSAGNLYFCSSSLNALFRMDTSGVVTRVAGTGIRGYSGDGGPAISAGLNTPNGVAVDAQGNVFVADLGNRRIRKVAPDGIISTVAGNGGTGSLGDGGPATVAQLNSPNGVAMDASGNLYIADTGNNLIRWVSGGIITTVAGNGVVGYAGDGGLAVAAQMNTPYRVAVDKAGNLYIADYGNHVIRRVSPDGLIATVAGNGSTGHGGDGGSATNAQLNSPYGIALDGAGNLYIADHFNQRIRLVTANGRIATLAGDGTPGHSGDGGPASLAELYEPQDVAVDSAGNLYVTDSHNNVIRKINPAGLIGTVVGGPTGDGGPAVLAELYGAAGLAKDASGNLYVADSADQRIRKIAPNGTISTLAGNGAQGYWGDGGPANSAQLYWPMDVALDGAGNLYLADSRNSCIRKVSASGAITRVAGNGTSGYAGDGGPAVLAQLRSPYGVTVDSAGSIYIADTANSVLRKVAPNGTITTVAGNGSSGFSGDGGPAARAQLNNPYGVAVSGSGEIYLADRLNHRVRKVSLDGTITTVAGNGVEGYSGDGGPATSAALNMPWGIAVDATGNLYVADFGNSRIRMVDTHGVITTVAGIGTSGYSGDGDLATRARLSAPRGLWVDAAGNIYFVDGLNNAVRQLTPVGAAPLLTIGVSHTGNFTAGQSGTYTLTVSNAASAASTSGAVTVTEFPPAALKLASIAGSGWSCSGNTCTRSDALRGGSSYPPITATVTVDAALSGQVTNRASVSGGGAPAAGASDLTLIPGRISAIVNGAGFAGGAAPGSVATIFGSNLANTTAGAATAPLPLSLAGVTLTINGIAVPLWYVSPGQINFEMPAETASGNAAAVVVTGAASSSAFSFNVPPTAPGIFVYGGNRAVAVNADYSLTDAGHPAAPGSVVTVYLTGLGPLDHPIATNSQAPAQPLCRPTSSVAATIGGQNAPVQFIGLTPGGIALAQANLAVPNLPPGDHPVTITVGSSSSNAPLISVGAR